MSMSSEKFSALTSEFPEEREAIEQLGELIGVGQRREMTLDHLILNLHPHSDINLARILERLVFDGTIGRAYRVESPGTHGEIQRYSTPDDIPPEVFDWHTGTILPVTPRNLQVVYSLI